MSLRVVARFIAKPDRIDDLKALLLSVIEPTRQERGCIEYELFQNQNNPADFTFVEAWESAEALDAHLAMPYIQAGIAQLPDLVAQPGEISRYDRLA